MSTGTSITKEQFHVDRVKSLARDIARLSELFAEQGKVLDRDRRDNACMSKTQRLQLWCDGLAALIEYALLAKRTALSINEVHTQRHMHLVNKSMPKSTSKAHENALHMRIDLDCYLDVFVGMCEGNEFGAAGYVSLDGVNLFLELLNAARTLAKGAHSALEYASYWSVAEVECDRRLQNDTNHLIACVQHVVNYEYATRLAAKRMQVA